jgi:hopanoid biosynthesis associated protein HpnK
VAPPQDEVIKRLVVTADDFGLSPEINEAVRLGHTRGILTAASLMVGAPAAADAVLVAKACPGLAVGLHLTLVDGRPVLPPEWVPDLVDETGRFRPGLAGPGARIFFAPRVRRQASAECQAQLEGFLATGLRLDHLNGHHHFHVHPSILGIVLGLARRYAIPAVRVPSEPWRVLRPKRVGLAAVMAFWAAWGRRRLRAAGILTNDALYGLFEPGAMVEAAWLRIIPRLRPGLTEVYCHPAVASAAGDAREGGSSSRPADELAALLSDAVRAALDRAGIRRVSFTTAASES